MNGISVYKYGWWCICCYTYLNNTLLPKDKNVLVEEKKKTHISLIFLFIVKEKSQYQCWIILYILSLSKPNKLTKRKVFSFLFVSIFSSKYFSFFFFFCCVSFLLLLNYVMCTKYIWIMKNNISSDSPNIKIRITGSPCSACNMKKYQFDRNLLLLRENKCYKN